MVGGSNEDRLGGMKGSDMTKRHASLVLSPRPSTVKLLESERYYLCQLLRDTDYGRSDVMDFLKEKYIDFRSSTQLKEDLIHKFGGIAQRENWVNKEG